MSAYEQWRDAHGMYFDPADFMCWVEQAFVAGRRAGLLEAMAIADKAERQTVAKKGQETAGLIRFAIDRRIHVADCESAS